MADSKSMLEEQLMQLTLQIRNRTDEDKKYAKFHGDSLIGDAIVQKVGTWADLKSALAPSNLPSLVKLISGLVTGNGLDGGSAARIAGSLSNYSDFRQGFINDQVRSKYDKMLHPPLTYLGSAFQYRTVDGKFNSVMDPHLGQAGAPYARTVPSITPALGALPDPGDLFDKLMVRQEGGRQSASGLSSMLVYHATIIIHDLFRTNNDDKNISDNSSYLDLSPLYGYTPKLQRQVRDDKYMLGFLKPDTFAEDRLLRQPPGVCIMLVMYNRYHNYAAAQLRRINEGGRFSLPKKYDCTRLEATVKYFYQPSKYGSPDRWSEIESQCANYSKAWEAYQAAVPAKDADLAKKESFEASTVATNYYKCKDALEHYLKEWGVGKAQKEAFEECYDLAWTKLDDDLYNTARLITCGMYIQISVHDYLRALMGFHAYNTNFTLDPRSDFDQKKTTRGLGNQVTVEFNLLYRFHCAISLRDEEYTEDYMHRVMGIEKPAETSLNQFLAILKYANDPKTDRPEPCDVTFGIPSGSKTDKDYEKHKSLDFTRNKTTNLFDDQQMVDALTAAMDEPISNFGPRNIPKCLKAIEVMGITQSRQWNTGTLNDFREFFGMSRHRSFESVSKNPDIQNALRDLYEHPDKIELYPGIFCESDEYMGLDPGPSEATSALWSAIFSDAITLVRSDRFYTVDWNTKSLTSWGMNEVTPNNEVCKSSIFHRLLQRAFPGWYPYDSVRFFHPFYTAQQNAIYAKQQGYGREFQISPKPDHMNPITGKFEFTVTKSSPAKPKKPVYLDDSDSIRKVLRDDADDFVHPALLNPANLPKVMREVLDAPLIDVAPQPEDGNCELEDTPAMTEYFSTLMRSLVKREAVAMTNSTFQIDVTRDFAIPAVTRYVADFLGFGHRIRSEKSLTHPHSENEIYQHITNCQTSLSYNADETKLLKRRTAFKSSMQFLARMTKEGNIAEANQWNVTQALFGRKRGNPMTELGFAVAQRILAREESASKAAAVLLFMGLDLAYNSVLAFSAVLDVYLNELYAAAKPASTVSDHPPEWLRIQKLAMSGKLSDQEALGQIVTKAARTSMRLPVMRKAIRNKKFETNGDKWEIAEGQIVILDIRVAAEAAELAGQEDALDFLTYQSSFAVKFATYSPKHIATLGLASMIGCIAQMKNARRGHDAQGHLKTIQLDGSEEGYSNFMAQYRVDRIAADTKELPTDQAKKVYTKDVLRPATETYLTAAWDEMIPFPTTWKIRFDGFGESDYSKDGNPFGKLAQRVLPDDAPPWYQPQGKSQDGGIFADVASGYAKTKADDGSQTHGAVKTAAELEQTFTTGCGLPHHPQMHQQPAMDGKP